MFVRNHPDNLGASASMDTGCRWHLLGVDGVIREYPCATKIVTTQLQNGTVQNTVVDLDNTPLGGDRAGFNIIQRVATGAYEFLPVGMPHPDRAVVTAPAPPTPIYNPAPGGAAAPAAPAPPSSVSYGEGNFVDTPATVQSGGYSTQQETSTSANPEKSGSGLLLILAAAVAAYFGTQ